MTSAFAHPRARRAGILAGLFVASGLWLLLSARPAHAAVTCSFAGGTVTITLASGDEATISRTSGGDFEVYGTGLSPTDCDTGGGPATVTTTDSVNVTGAGGNETVTIDLAGGFLAPGATAEAAGSNADDIEIAIDFAGGTDTLVVEGGSGDDVLRLGAGGVNLNDDSDNDGDTDVEYVAPLPENVTVDAGAGADVVRAIGGLGTGAAFSSPLTVNGGSGDDTIDGGAGADTIDGGMDDDAVDGGAGTDDTLSYASAPAAVDVTLGASSSGGAGVDSIAGIENLTGSPFSDRLAGVPGADNTITGGLGADTVDYAGHAAVTANIGTGTVTTSGETDTFGDDMENLIGSSNGDGITGDGGPNVLDGAAGDDTIDGSSGDDTVIGGAGNDPSLAGGLGNDGVDGGSGNDTISEGAATNGSDDLGGGTGTDLVTYAARVSALSITIDGAANDGQVSPAEGDDVATDVENVTGGGAADTLGGSTGDNVLTGGGSLDTATYADAPDGVSASLLLAGAQNTEGAGTDTLSGITHLTGSSFGDVLTGSAAGNTLTGLGGDDTLLGHGSDDTLIGGLGDDILEGGTDASGDSLVGDSGGGNTGSDTARYSGSGAGVTIDLALLVAQGGAGDGAGDIISEIENVTGSDSGDTLSGTTGANVLNGAAGNDTLVGRASQDTLNGGGGLDTASYAGAPAAVNVDLSDSDPQNTGGDGLDTLTAIENLTGSSFDDLLAGDDGNNTLDGGSAGNDTVSFASATAGVSATLGAPGSATGFGTDVLTGFDNITGGAFDDFLTGDAGVNVLGGGGGDDDLAGLGGADVLDGGTGSNTANYSASAAGTVVNLTTFNAGATRVTGLAGGDAGGDELVVTDGLSTIRSLTGSASGDTYTGDDRANRFVGNGGDDDFTGGLGNDTFAGGGHGAGGDTVRYAERTGDVVAAIGSSGGEGAEQDAIGGDVENLTGGTGDDELAGDTDGNSLTGGLGNDQLEGGGAGDVLIGDTGGGNSGTDTASYAGSPAAVAVDLQAPSASGGDATGDTTSEIENLLGSSFADTLTGSGTPNVLDGGPGNDILSGGADVTDDASNDDDTFVGGTGGDTVTYEGQIDVEAASLLPAPVQATIGGQGRVDTKPDSIADPDPGFEEIDAIGADVENLTGAGANDILIGNDGANILVGLAGDDLLIGREGDDALAGDTRNVSPGFFGTATAGSDVLTGEEGDDSLFGDSFVVQTFGVLQTNDDVLLDGGPGDDTIYGDNFIELDFGSREVGGSDSLEGGADDDRLFGSNVVQFFDGAGTLAGGADTDTAAYATAPAGVTVDLSLSGTALPLPAAPGTPQDTQGAGTDTLSDIDGLAGSPFGDALTGNAGANTLSGGAGGDTLDGAAGLDTLNGEVGDDVLIGGPASDDVTGGSGADTLSYESSTGDLVIDLTAATTGDGPDSLLDTLENATGGSGADDITGTTADNVLDGGPGDDTIHEVGASPDGADVLKGGAGAADRVTYETRTDAVRVSLNNVGDDGEGVEGDNVMNDVEDVTGSSDDDVLSGSAAENDLDGLAGDDRLLGGNGDDTLDGGSGNDILDAGNDDDDVNGGSGSDDILEGSRINGSDDLDGGSGTDRAFYGKRRQNLRIDVDNTADDGESGEGDNVRSSIEKVHGGWRHDRIAGNSGANVFYGDRGNDILGGGGGDDRMVGASGADYLSGGSGNDRMNGSIDPDKIVGGSGHDLLDGDGGNDVLLANDGTDDVVRGDAGYDKARIDADEDSTSGIDQFI